MQCRSLQSVQDDEAIVIATHCRRAQRCLHVFDPAPRCRRPFPPPRRTDAVDARAIDRARLPVADVGGVARAVRGLALTSLADSAAHRRVASDHRSARQRHARGADPHRRHQRAVERLGAGDRAARRARPRRRAARRAHLAARLRRLVAALAARARAAFRAAPDRRREPRRAARQERPHPRRRPRLRERARRLPTTTRPPTGSSGSTSS